MKLNPRGKYLGQRPFLFPAIVRLHRHTHTHTHTDRTDCTTRTTKVVGKSRLVPTPLLFVSRPQL